MKTIRALSGVLSLAVSLGGRSLGSNRTREKSGDKIELAVDVPLAQAGNMLAGLRQNATINSTQQRRDDDVPEGSLSRARVIVTLRPPAAVGAERDLAGAGTEPLAARCGRIATRRGQHTRDERGRVGVEQLKWLRGDR